MVLKTVLILWLLPERLMETYKASFGQTGPTSSNIVEYKFVVRMFDDNQTLFITIEHQVPSI